MRSFSAFNGIIVFLQGIVLGMFSLPIFADCFCTSLFGGNLIPPLTFSLHYVVFKVQPRPKRRGTVGIIAVFKAFVNGFLSLF